MNSHTQRIINWQLTLAIGGHLSVTQDMIGYLKSIEKDGTLWKPTAWKCIELVQRSLLQKHADTMPEMACQQSGNCCTKGVPRVSVFELERMAEHITTLSDEDKQAIVKRCRESVAGNYKDAILGEGVPCPMLGKKDGRHVCMVHDARPVICWASGITTPLSWDCPLWQIHKRHFPTLPREDVMPFLHLFGYTREAFCRMFLGNAYRKQMMLIGTGVLALFGEMPVENPKHPYATATLSHTYEPSEDLWTRKMEPPPAESSKSDS